MSSYRGFLRNVYHAYTSLELSEEMTSILYTPTLCPRPSAHRQAIVASDTCTFPSQCGTFLGVSRYMVSGPPLHPFNFQDNRSN